MNRKDIEQCVTGMYQARVNNDAEACIEFFTPDAHLALVGEDESVYQSKESISTNVGQQIRDLVAAWNWKEISDERIVIDGRHAAAFYRLNTVFTPTGDEINTHLSDHIVMSDCGRIAEFIEFVDTALVKSLAAKIS